MALETFNKALKTTPDDINLICGTLECAVKENNFSKLEEHIHFLIEIHKTPCLYYLNSLVEKFQNKCDKKFVDNLSKAIDLSLITFKSTKLW
jgi:hypothetical protein